MAYTFRDTTPFKRTNVRRMTSDSIAIGTTWLEDKFTNFTTLYTEGRGVVNVNLETVATPNDGEFFTTKSLNSREFKQVGFIKASDSKELLTTINDMRNFLYKPGRTSTKFRFYDNQEYDYKADAIYISSIDDGTLTPKIEITYYCSDPYAYKRSPFRLNLGERMPSKQFGNDPRGSHPSRLYIEPGFLNSYIYQNGAKFSNNITILSARDKGLTERSGSYWELDFKTGSLLFRDFAGDKYGERLLDINSKITDNFLKTNELWRVSGTSESWKECYLEFEEKELF